MDVRLQFIRRQMARYQIDRIFGRYAHIFFRPSLLSISRYMTTKVASSTTSCWIQTSAILVCPSITSVRVHQLQYLVSISISVSSQLTTFTGWNLFVAAMTSDNDLRSNLIERIYNRSHLFSTAGAFPLVYNSANGSDIQGSRGSEVLGVSR